MMTMNTKKVRIISIGVVAIAIALIAVVAISTVPQITQVVIPYVTVSGSVSTEGYSTAPLSVDFTSETGSVNSATVSEDGNYSITLANQHSYSTTVHWSAALGLAGGTCDAGKLDIYTSSPLMNRNLSC
jgi:hypothetical protein